MTSNRPTSSLRLLLQLRHQRPRPHSVAWRHDSALPTSRSYLGNRTSTHAFSSSARCSDATAPDAAELTDEALLKRIKEELKNAMRAKDTVAAGTLRALLSSHQYAQKAPSSSSGGDGGGGSRAPSLVTLIQRQVAKHAECAALFRDAKPPRHDLADKEEAEARVVSRFLPDEMGEEELRREVQRVVDEIAGAPTKAAPSGGTEKKPPNMGDVIKRTAQAVGARSNAKAIARVAREVLGIGKR